ncbi:MAG: hypothetical protein WCX65_08680 [bacterium]
MAAVTHLTATGPLVASNTYYLNVIVTDNVNNKRVMDTEFIYKYDPLSPTVVINSPDASAYVGADFTVDVTNADTGGSGINLCYYQVTSNVTITVPWATYDCALGPTILVGPAQDCKNPGADKCLVELYNTDNAGNTSATVSRTFSVDWTAPVVTINNPDPSSWQKTDFTLDVTNTSGGGASITCYYQVTSNSVVTLAWTAYACASNPTITVGVGNDCRDQGADMCFVECKDKKGGSYGPLASRSFSIDWTAPSAAITSPAASSWQNTDFTLSVTNADTGGSGLDICYYRVLSDSVETLALTSYACATNPTITVGGGKDCRDEGVDKCLVEVYNTDEATNQSSSDSRLFGIDFTAPATTDNWTDNWTAASPVTVTLSPVDSISGVIDSYYCVDNTDTCSPATSSVSVSVTCAPAATCIQYVRYYAKDNAGNSETVVSKRVRQDREPPAFVYNSPAAGTATADYAADPGAILNIDVSYLNGAPLVSFEHSVNSGAWSTIWGGSQSADYLTDWAVNWATMPEGSNQIALRASDSVGNVATDNYVLNTSGFLFKRAVTAQPDYLELVPQGDSVITVDVPVASWCFGTAADCACNYGGTDFWCSNLAATITAQPDYVKYHKAAVNQRFGFQPGNMPAALQWSWDAVKGRIILNDDPTGGGSVYYTPGGGREEVCVFLRQADDSQITTSAYADYPVYISLSGAQASGKDFTEVTYGFNAMTIPASGDVAPTGQIELKGNLQGGKACFTLTAETMPTDAPLPKPIIVSATYFDGLGATMTLPQIGGTSATIPVYIRNNFGVSDIGGVNVVEDVFIPQPNTPTRAIVLSPAWNQDGTKIVANSREDIPCDMNPPGQTADTGDSPFDNFNLYTMTYSGGTLQSCVRLTSNGTDGLNFFGAAPYSDITWTPDGDRVVFAAPDMMTDGKTKLFWVSATAPVGTPYGTQFDYPPAGPVLDSLSIVEDSLAGGTNVTVDLIEGSYIDVGKKVIIFETDGSGRVIKREIKTVTGVTQDYVFSQTHFTVDTPMTQDIYGQSSGVTSYIEYPVTLRRLGQNIVPLSDDSLILDAEWRDPDWSPNLASCDAAYRDKLLAVRTPGDPSYDTVCNPNCSTDPDASVNGNIVMIDGAKDFDGLYKVDGVTSNLTKITSFVGQTPFAYKPKWSPDCKMIAFVAWDRSLNTSDPPAPSQTSIYVINLSYNGPGFATVTLPVTSLTDPGVYKIYGYDENLKPAYFPKWNADGKVVSFSVDMTNSLFLQNDASSMDTVVSDLFGSVNFDNYMEYILDQPPSQGAVFAPQLVGQVSSNEFGLTQCPGNNTGAACPDGPNFPFVHVMQPSPASGAYLQLLHMKDVTTVTAGGGLLFKDGLVTAVFPPNTLASDTVFFNTDPTAYCGGGPGPGPDCPHDPTNEFIVQSGEAREYFPDGTNFDSYIRLIFHYCDNDSDGKVDADTESVFKATAAGTVPFTFNSSNGQCAISGAPTSGGTIDVDTIAVYNWNLTGNKWDRMDGLVNKTDRTITVFTTHFSRYDTFGFRMGFAPASITPLQITNIHTYPNPYVETRDLSSGITFAGDEIYADANAVVTIDIKVYDMRGSLVTTLTGATNQNDAHVNNSHTLYHWARPANASGRPLASGIYLYYLTARSNGDTVTHKGKLSVVR